MEISIVEVLENNSVRFATEFGCVAGKWCGIEKPQKKEYFVELDVKDQLEFTDFTIITEKYEQIVEVENGVLVTGILDEYEKEGCIVIRLKRNLIEIEVVPNDRFFDLIGTHIRCFVKEINLYDENV